MTVNNATSHREKLISGLGGFLAIAATLSLVQFAEEGLRTPVLLLASMGATAVLLFAAPHGPMSQPKNVIAGHVMSAAIALVIHKAVSDPVLGGALAVGAAITAMHYLNALHPPGAATALIPFVGGPAASEFGYWLPLFPVGASAVLMVAAAIAYNYPFAWRRYPASLAVLPKPAAPGISHADLVVALAELDSYMDISEEDLLTIYALATKNKDGAGPGSKRLEGGSRKA